MQKIHVKNFKAIKDMEIELDKALLLIGEQASGKSTISKLIYFFKSLRQDFIDSIYDVSDESFPLELNFRNKIYGKFYNYFGTTKHLGDFEITYSYTENAYIKLSLKSHQNLNIQIEPNFLQRLFSSKMKEFSITTTQFSTQENAFDRKVFQQIVKNIEDYVNSLFNDTRHSLFIPAGRNITVNYPEQFKLYGNLQSDLKEQQRKQTESVDLHLMLQFLEHTERDKQRFQSHGFESLLANRPTLDNSINTSIFNLVNSRINKILKGKYSQDQYGEKLHVGNEKYIYLRNASSGQQEAIRILQDIFLVLLDGDDVFRVIEEPEAHLYPMAQKHLMELIAIVLNESDSQIIMTTHSPYILSIINNLLFATRVAQKNRETVGEVNTVLPKACWLNPDTTNVYFLNDGHCHSVFDEETGLIDQNSLDGISEELGADFEDLYDIYARASHG